jgi:hypothetical protein
MDRLTLAQLEQSIEPYRRAGFVVTSQSEGAITLALPPERFSYALFILLMLIWPLAVIYLVYHNNQGAKSVCLRVTSQGYIEESGYTLGVMERERKRRIFIGVLLFSIVAAVILFILIQVYLAGKR